MIPPLAALTDALTSFEARLVISAVVIVGVVAVAGVVRWLRGHLDPRNGPISSVWNIGLTLVVTAAAGIGATVLIAIWGVQDDVHNAITQFDVTPQTGALTVLSLVVIAAAYVLLGVVKRVIESVADSSGAFSRHQREVAYRVTQVVVYVVAGIAILGLWSVNLGGLLVGAGFLGIVVGLAARQTLGALLAGFVLMFSRPFEIGDWVQVGDKEGIVTDITIVNTRVQTFDGEYVMLPNDMVSSNDIVNRSRKGRLRINVDVGVDYDADLDHATAVAKDAMTDVDAVLSVPQPQVVLREFGDSAIVLGLRFWIDKPSARRKWRAQTAVIESVKTAFDDEGVKIPFPQRELMGRGGEGGFRVAEAPPEGMVVSEEESDDVDAGTGDETDTESEDGGSVTADAQEDPEDDENASASEDAEDPADDAERPGGDENGGGDEDAEEGGSMTADAEGDANGNAEDDDGPEGA